MSATIAACLLVLAGMLIIGLFAAVFSGFTRPAPTVCTVCQYQNGMIFSVCPFCCAVQESRV